MVGYHTRLASRATRCRDAGSLTTPIFLSTYLHLRQALGRLALLAHEMRRDDLAREVITTTHRLLLRRRRPVLLYQRRHRRRHRRGACCGRPLAHARPALERWGPRRRRRTLDLTTRPSLRLRLRLRAAATTCTVPAVGTRRVGCTAATAAPSALPSAAPTAAAARPLAALARHSGGS
eukprot:scaffold77859_cov29-Phaeocystis_antarctica.AAC.1